MHGLFDKTAQLLFVESINDLASGSFEDALFMSISDVPHVASLAIRG